MDASNPFESPATRPADADDLRTVVALQAWRDAARVSLQVSSVSALGVSLLLSVTATQPMAPIVAVLWVLAGSFAVASTRVPAAWSDTTSTPGRALARWRLGLGLCLTLSSLGLGLAWTWVLLAS